MVRKLRWTAKGKVGVKEYGSCLCLPLCVIWWTSKDIHIPMSGRSLSLASKTATVVVTSHWAVSRIWFVWRRTLFFFFFQLSRQLATEIKKSKYFSREFESNLYAPNIICMRQLLWWIAPFELDLVSKERGKDALFVFWGGFIFRWGRVPFCISQFDIYHLCQYKQRFQQVWK